MSETLEVLQSRTIKIYSTLAQNLRTIETTARNAGELMAEMDQAGIPYRGMSMVIGETAQGLVGATSALLPGEQTILLMPIDVKSGWEPEEDFLDEQEDDEEEDDFEEDYEDQDEEEITPLEKATQLLEAVVEDLNEMVSNLNTAISHLREVASSPTTPKVAAGPVDPEIERLNMMAASIKRTMGAASAVSAAGNIFE